MDAKIINELDYEHNFYVDSGHGWLKVKHIELKILNIENKISKL